jgi:NAD(P)-dependent dehydrogenase (short-subunit alcohol dehydrogenase family)|tara:strand:+ start:1001 stop:1666 length:666 start_codon:yes stop_codon:yes gene_type:complete
LNKKILIFGGESDIASSVIKKGYNTIFCPVKECDITVQRDITKALKKYKPSIVVNCAGISNVQLVKNSDVKKWKQEIDVNLTGSYLIARECASLNVKTMIFIASVAGKYGKPEHSGYSASKCAVISFVQSLGLEGYDVYSISPGRVDTKMREKDYPGEDKRTRLPREDVAEVVFDCIEGKYTAGDNIIIRKKGFRKLLRVDKGAPWKEYLNVQPYGTPKEI